jgi:hypothetical protein
MLIISVILSAGLVAYVYSEFKKQRLFAYEHFVLGALAVLMIPLGGFMPTLALHAFLVIMGAILWKSKQWSAVSLRRYMIYAALPGYTIAIFLAAQNMIEQYRLRGEFPYESMDERVPPPKKSAVNKLSDEAKKYLDEMDSKLAVDRGASERTYALRQLHENSVEAFINSPGFGVGRSIRASDINWTTLTSKRDDEAISQPGSPFASTLVESDFTLSPNRRDLDSTRQTHVDGVLDFVNPAGFGVIESRKKVLGFQSHRFRKLPKSERLRIGAIELVGLLMHPEPVVYISDNLPSMKEARTAPKRALNHFESAALKNLYEGNDFFIRQTTEGVRALGAIRAGEQCVKCHGGIRGDLLGAFSYSLQRD